MANLVSLADLQSRALDYADMTGSGFPDTNRLTDYINSSASQLYDLLVNSFSDYFLKTHSFSVSSGSEDYDLPSDFYKMKKVFWVSGNRRYPVKAFQLSELDGLNIGPLISGTCELWYVPEMSLLDSSDPTKDTIGETIPPVVPGWEDFIALGAAIRLLTREESDPSALIMERSALESRIIALAEPRDSDEPTRIQDSKGRFSRRINLDPDASSVRYRLMGSKLKLIQFDQGA
jgi:hypothetical protein